MESCPTYFGVEDAELRELADALKILHVYCDTKDWNEDDFISVFEELTSVCFKFLYPLKFLNTPCLLTRGLGVPLLDILYNPQDGCSPGKYISASYKMSVNEIK